MLSVVVIIAREDVSSVLCQNAIFVLVRGAAVFICTGFLQVASLFPSSICSWAVYKKQSLRILPWSRMLHSTAKRQVKCHVWKICSSNFLFVKWLAGAISRSFFAERVDSCADDSVLAKTAHLCSCCLSVPNTAVKHRCLGWVISVPLYMCD